MQKYKQLDLKDRHKIKGLLQANHTRTKIAEIIGVHKSTISRELSRNMATSGRYANEYRPESAQRKTNKRHHNKRKHIRFTESILLRNRLLFTYLTALKLTIMENLCIFWTKKVIR